VSEKEKDPAQKEVEEIQRVLQPKRSRTHSVTSDEEEECSSEKPSWDDWDLTDHRREVTRKSNGRSHDRPDPKCSHQS
jgi:hypothetical protein